MSCKASWDLPYPIPRRRCAKHSSVCHHFVVILTTAPTKLKIQEMFHSDFARSARITTRAGRRGRRVRRDRRGRQTRSELFYQVSSHGGSSINLVRGAWNHRRSLPWEVGIQAEVFLVHRAPHPITPLTQEAAAVVPYHDPSGPHLPCGGVHVVYACSEVALPARTHPQDQ